MAREGKGLLALWPEEDLCEIALDDLREGMRLAKDIRRDSGVLVMPAETALTRDKEEIGKAMEKKVEMAKKMEAEIESKARDLKDMIEIEAGKHQMVIRLMGETAFDSGEARIRQEMLPLLKKIASILKGTKGEIVIAGHTDNVPVSGVRFRSNLQLSIERATRVTELLLAQEPIAPERISAVGFGKFRPLESNDTAEGRKRNRRVEIIIKDMPPPE